MTDAATTSDFVLRLRCPDRPGIVHAVSGFLVNQDANIVASAQYGDAETGRFFMRVEFETAHPTTSDRLRAHFANVADEYGMWWELWRAEASYRTLIMVSRTGHCLHDMLYRWSAGSLQIEIPAIVSNHRDLEGLAAQYGIPFHHVPVTPETKAEAEAQLLDLVSSLEIDLVVLARYMQVLSDETCRRLSGQAINIHHSFLPSFKGARPYHQAHARGVKLIGATTHYVTSDLDEGPIIEQDVVRVGHRDGVDSLIRQGADVERSVLLRAVRWFC
ncbi:MAG: formyltetrahydrofolate deformylase, partial [Nocardioidaceae bacterium]